MDHTKDHKRQRNLFFYLFAAGFILLISLCFILSTFYIDFFPRKYFMLDQKDNKTYALSSLRNPIITSESLLNWAQLATISLNTFQSSTIETQISHAVEKYFTNAGAKSYLASLKMKGTVNDVVTKLLTITSVVQKPPVILQQGVLLGRYTWKVQIPILITYSSLSEIKVSPQLITLTITVLPSYINPNGLGISQYNATKM